MDVVTEKQNKSGIAMWFPLLVVCIAQVGTSGDNSVLSMSTNEFITQLNASMNQVQLANIIYSLLAGALMVFGGMLGIAKGFKQVFMTGAALCAAGEALAVISPTMDTLIWGARSLAGFGAALMIPSVLGIIVSLYEGKERAVAFGGVGAATGVAAVVMPIGAGIIMDASGYQVAFSTMSAWFVLVFLAAWKLIPNIKPAQMRVDYVGTVMTSLGLLAFIIGCSKISEWGLIEPMSAPFTIMGISPALPLAIIGIVIMGVTMMVEKQIEQKHGAALIPQSFIKIRQVRNGLYVTGLIFAVFGVAFFITPSWIMVVAGSDATATGLAVAIMAAPMIILSLAIPKKYSYLSPRAVIMVSSVMLCLGAILMSFSLQADGFDPMFMYSGLFSMGFGLGGYSSQSAMIVASALNPRDAAQSGGIQCSARNVWQAAGVAIIGAVLLFSSTLLYKSEIAQSDVAPVVKAYVAETPVHSFMSNQALLDKLTQSGAEMPQAEEALSIYKEVRIKSAQNALWALALFILLHIPGFMGIPTQGWTQKP